MSATQIKNPPEVSYAKPQLSSTQADLVRASDNLWRVQDAAGRIVGHMRIVTDPLGLRYRAERLHLVSGVFRVVGEFWRPDDAVQSLRNG